MPDTLRSVGPGIRVRPLVGIVAGLLVLAALAGGFLTVGPGPELAQQLLNLPNPDASSAHNGQAPG